MTKATHTQAKSLSIINRRSVLTATITAATATAAAPARAGAPVFAPSDLGRQMLALAYEARAAKWPEDNDEFDRAHEAFNKRYEELGEKILEQPISSSSIVDRAIMRRFARLDDLVPNGFEVD